MVTQSLSGRDVLNHPPIAVDDTVSTLASTTVLIPVLKNDSDPDQDALQIALVGAAAHGRASTVSGQIQYVPFAGYVGLDRFYYVISDGRGGSASATVQITIGSAAATPTPTPTPTPRPSPTPTPVSTPTPPAGAHILPSRTQCVVPCAVYFDQPGPIEDDYLWNFGDGTSAPGFQAAHVFEDPGTYNVTLIQKVWPSGTAQGDAVSIRVLPFTGTTFYIDAVAGNDTNTGTTPQTAWKGARMINIYLNALPASSRANLRFLLKRGQSWELTENGSSASWIWMKDVPGPIRIGAYANADGSDDATQPKPLIFEDRNRGYSSPSEEFISHPAGYHSADVAYRDLHLKGHYAPVYGQTANYPMHGIGIFDSDHLLFLRLELEYLNGGIWLNWHASTNIFLEGISIRHVRSTPIYGESHHGYALQNSTLEDSSSSHLHYVGARGAVIRNNRLKDSGVWVNGTQVNGQDGLRLCGLFTDPAANPDGAQTGRYYIADNEISESSGPALALQSNGSQEIPPIDAVIERNKLMGSTPPAMTAGWADAPIMWIISLQNGIVRNNLILNQRGPIELHQGDNQVMQDLRVINNTLVSTGPTREAFMINKPASGAKNITIENNVIVGPFAAVLKWAEPSISFPPLGFLMDRNLYHGLATATPAYWITGFAGAFPGDWNSIIGQDPQLLSLDPTNSNYMRPALTSPVADRADTRLPIYDDYYRTTRQPGVLFDLGAVER